MKIEQAINRFLIYLGELMVRLLKLLFPEKIRSFLLKLFTYIVQNFKSFPKQFFLWNLNKLSGIKNYFKNLNYREKFNETYNLAITEYNNENPDSNKSKIKRILLTPFLIVGQWVSGLTVGQTILLLGFTGASVLAGMNIVFTGNRLMEKYRMERSPASLDDESSYDRPDYYKEYHRHLSVTNLRLPVYTPQINELRSVDIDFTATLNNRNSRLFLERFEFQLRDHLILEMEPMIAAFPLEDEGKEIIRQKILREINLFLLIHEINGEVVDLKLTYILAN